MAFTILSTQNLTASSATVSVSDDPSGTFNGTRLTVADTTPAITGGQITISEGANTETKRIISVTNGTQFVIEHLTNAYTTAAIVSFYGFTNAGDPEGQTLVSGATGLMLNGSKNKAEVFFNTYAKDLLTLWQKVVDKTDGKLTSADLELKTDATSAGDRSLKMWLSGSTWIRLFWDNTASKFKLNNQAGTLQALQVAEPAATSDAATKNYVDTLLAANNLPKRYFYSGKPIRTGNSTLTITDIDCLDDTETFRITKSGTLTFDLSTGGTGGCLSSTASDGMAGTVSVTSGSATVTGTGTQFTDVIKGFKPGDVITTNGIQSKVVLSISSDTSLTTASTFGSSETGVAYKRNSAAAAPSARLNLYVISAGKSNTTYLCVSPRSVVKGDTLVDLPVVSKTGTVAISSGSTSVTGTGTAFTTELEIGWTIRINGEVKTITAIADDTHLSVDTVYSSTTSGITCYLYYVYYRQLPFSVPINSSGNLVHWNVAGWPFAVAVTYSDYDGGSSFSVGATASTSEQNKNLWNLSNLTLVPPIAAKFSAYVSASKTGGSVPSNVATTAAGVSGITYQVANVQEFTTTGPTFNYITGTQMLDLDLDSSGILYYKSFDANITISVSVRGYYVTEWK